MRQAVLVLITLVIALQPVSLRGQDGVEVSAEDTKIVICPLCGAENELSIEVSETDIDQCSDCGLPLRYSRQHYTLKDRIYFGFKQSGFFREQKDLDRTAEHIHDHLKGSVEYRGLFYGYKQTRSSRFFNLGQVNLKYETDLIKERLRLTLSPELLFDDAALAEGIVDGRERQRYRYNFAEAFTHLSLGDLDLAWGKQIVHWGRAEEINPTNNINSQDYSDLLESRKMGAEIIRGKYYLGDLTSLEAVWQPVFSPNILPSRNNGLTEPWHLPPYENAKADDLGHESQGGLRFDSSVRGWDFSLSYYHWLSRSPSLRLKPLAPPKLVYNRFQVFGADFGTALWGINLKGEGAYLLPRDRFGDKSLRYIAGGDRLWEDVFRERDSLRLSVQYAGEQVLQEGEDIEYPDWPFVNSVLAKADYHYNEWVGFSLSGVYNINRGSRTRRQPPLRGGDFYLQPELSCEISEGLKLVVGADILSGPQGSFFGNFGKNDRVSFSLKWEF